MSLPLAGSCFCGAVRYRLTALPMFVHCCHCTDCQMQTGGAFAINALIERDRIVLEPSADPAPIPMKTESGRPHYICRCPVCQTALWSHYGGMGEKAAFVRVGTLEDPDTCPPQVHIFTRSKQPWFELPIDGAAYEIFYSRDDLETLFGNAGAARWRALRGG